MGFFDKFKRKKEDSGSSPAPQPKAAQSNLAAAKDTAIQGMLANAAAAVDAGRPEQAFAAYQEILKLTPNADAQYNLGSLYAMGKGTEQDFLQAAFWFHQAALQGDAQAEKLCSKSTMDYLHQNFDAQTPETLFQKCLKLTSLLYPQENAEQLAGKTLYELGGFHFNKQTYAAAAKFFRAGAEFAGHGGAQNYLAVLYNNGAGVPKNDLAALYWFDKAVDQQFAASLPDRDGILNAYRTNNSAEDFRTLMLTLADWCQNGSADIPQDVTKAERWRGLAG